MIENLETLLARIADGNLPSRADISWGDGSPNHGGPRLTVFSDGEVQIRPQQATQDQAPVTGRVPLAAVQELAHTLLQQDLAELTRPNPDSPDQASPLLVSGSETSWQLLGSPTALANHPELALLQQAFDRVRDLANPQAAPTGPVEPMSVRNSGIFSATMLVGGILTCGLVGVMLWVVSRKMPRTMNATGLRLRNGRRYRWADLTLRKRVASHDEHVVLGYDLLTTDGVGIRLAEGAFQDGEQVLAYALARMSEA